MLSEIEKIQPLLASTSARAIARQISVSRWCAGRIREGYRPHPRHWQALGELIGLSSLGLWYESRNRNFINALPELAEKLETRKCELRAALCQIDEQLAQQNVEFEWSMLPGFVSLVPEGRFNVVATLRTATASSWSFIHNFCVVNRSRVWKILMDCKVRSVPNTLNSSMSTGVP